MLVRKISSSADDDDRSETMVGCTKEQESEEQTTTTTTTISTSPPSTPIRSPPDDDDVDDDKNKNKTPTLVFPQQAQESSHLWLPHLIVPKQPKQWQTAVKQEPQQSQSQHRRRQQGVGGAALCGWCWCWCWYVLDLLLGLVLGSLAVTQWTNHVYLHYLEPQYQTMFWTEPRILNEMTYFARDCWRPDYDLTTQDALDLVVAGKQQQHPHHQQQHSNHQNDNNNNNNNEPNNNTINNNEPNNNNKPNNNDDNNNDYANRVYWHQLHHGFTVIPHVMQMETMTNLRQYILHENKRIGHLVPIQENANRSSFVMNVQHPAVTKALMELSNHPQLR